MKVPWTEEPGGLQSMGSLRVEHNCATSLSLFTFMHWKRKWHPLQCSCLENPRDRGAWWAAVCGVAPSRTRLKRLSSNLAVACEGLSASLVFVFCSLFFILCSFFLPSYGHRTFFRIPLWFMYNVFVCISCVAF